MNPNEKSQITESTGTASRGASPSVEVLKWVWPYTAGQRLPIALLFGMNSIIGASHAAMIHAMKHLVDCIAGRSDKWTLLMGVVMYAGITLSAQVLRIFYARWRQLVIMRVKTRLQCELYSKYSTLPGEQLLSRGAGTFCNQMNQEVGNVATAIQTAFEIVDAVIIIISMLVAAFAISPVITLTVMTVVPILRFIGFSRLKRIRGVQARLNEQSAGVNQMLIETFGMMRIIRVFQGEALLSKQFAARLAGMNETHYQNIIDGDRIHILKQTSLYIFLGMIYFWFGQRSGAEGASAGSFVALTSLLSSLTGHFEFFFFLQTTFHQLHGAGAEVSRILSMDVSKNDQGTREIERPIQEIVFENVSFSFPNSSQLILDRANLVIRGGETVVLMGSSGAGKSTLLNLLIRMYEPLQGRILINGVDIREYSLKSLRENLALVGQETGLMSDSVLENIRLGKPPASLEEVKKAARAANADHFIAALPGGYDSPVGNEGKNLSQGQKQRISIARAFLKDSPILLLDEPTAGLDQESMQVLQDTLMQPSENRISLMILHDTQNIPVGARIVRLVNRKLKESDSTPILKAVG